MAIVPRRRGVLRAAAGSLVHSSCITMQSCGDADPDVCQFDDFAPGEQVFGYDNSPLRLDVAELSCSPRSTSPCPSRTPASSAACAPSW